MVHRRSTAVVRPTQSTAGLTTRCSRVAEPDRCAIHGDILEEVEYWSDEDDYDSSWLCPACDPDEVDAWHAAVRRSEDEAAERGRQTAEFEAEVRSALIRRNNATQRPAE